MPTKQFKWIDRDTAARDMLQLVYHAPPQIANQALKLLRAIRSLAIIPELKAMFLDEEYDTKRRSEIYEIICTTPGNFDFSEFVSVISKVFGSYNFYAYVFRVLDQHPTNLTWILHEIEAKDPYEQSDIYLRVLGYLPELVIEPLIKILTENEKLLDKRLAFRLHQYGDEVAQNWLVLHWDQIIRLWLTDGLNGEQGKYYWRLRDLAYLYKQLDKWPELKHSLSELTPEWMLKHFAEESATQLRLIYIRLLPLAPQIAFILLLKAFETKQFFLDLEIAGLLHEFGDASVQIWLKDHWDELIYLCLIDSVGTTHHAEQTRIVHVLEKWPELKEALFKNSPSMIEEYHQKRAIYNIGNLERVSDSDIQASSVWQALEQRRKAYVEPDKSVSELNKFSSTLILNAQSEADIPKIAAETYFLGIVTEFDDNAGYFLRRLLEKGSDTWRHKEFLYIWDEHQPFVYTPLQFEAAYALRNVATPRMWETFIEVFFNRPSVFAALSNEYLEGHMICWISRMTDMLSGVEPELPDEEIPLNARPWFRALVQRESNTS